MQFRPQWRCHERIRGAATWDDLDRLFELAAKYRLRVARYIHLNPARTREVREWLGPLPDRLDIL